MQGGQACYIHHLGITHLHKGGARRKSGHWVMRRSVEVKEKPASAPELQFSTNMANLAKSGKKSTWYSKRKPHKHTSGMSTIHIHVMVRVTINTLGACQTAANVETANLGDSEINTHGMARKISFKQGQFFQVARCRGMQNLAESVVINSMRNKKGKSLNHSISTWPQACQSARWWDVCTLRRQSRWENRDKR